MDSSNTNSQNRSSNSQTEASAPRVHFWEDRLPERDGNWGVFTQTTLDKIDAQMAQVQISESNSNKEQKK